MMGHTTAHEEARPGSMGRVLVIPGLDGNPRLLMAVAPRLYPVLGVELGELGARDLEAADGQRAELDRLGMSLPFSTSP